MNGNNSNNITAISIARDTIRVVIPPFFLMTNLFILITIICSKSLHNKSHFIILSHAFAEIFMAIIHFLSGVLKCLNIIPEYPDDPSTRLMCLWRQSFEQLGVRIVRSFTLFLAVDRLMCVGLPMFYNTTNTLKYLITINVLIWSYSIIFSAGGFVNFDRNKPVLACGWQLDQDFLNAANMEQNVFVALAVTCYLIAGAILLRRYKTTTFSSESQKSEWRKQMDWHVFKSVSLIGALYIFFAVTSTTLNATAYNNIDKIAKAEILRIINLVFILTHPITNFFIYLGINRLFRKAFFDLFKCRGNASNVSSSIRMPGVSRTAVVPLNQ